MFDNLMRHLNSGILPWTAVLFEIRCSEAVVQVNQTTWYDFFQRVKSGFEFVVRTIKQGWLDAASQHRVGLVTAIRKGHLLAENSS